MSYDDDDVTVRAVVAYTYFSVSIKKQKHGVETNNKNKTGYINMIMPSKLVLLEVYYFL